MEKKEKNKRGERNCGNWTDEQAGSHTDEPKEKSRQLRYSLERKEIM